MKINGKQQNVSFELVHLKRKHIAIFVSVYFLHGGHLLTLKAPKLKLQQTILTFYFYLSKKIRSGVSGESST